MRIFIISTLEQKLLAHSSKERWSVWDTLCAWQGEMNDTYESSVGKPNESELFGDLLEDGVEDTIRRYLN
jgi:hypothetical protein